MLVFLSSLLLFYSQEVTLSRCCRSQGLCPVTPDPRNFAFPLPPVTRAVRQLQLPLSEGACLRSSLPLQCRFQEDRDSVCFGYHGVSVWHVMFVVQSLSCVRLFATPWTTAHQASLSFTISWSLLKLMSTELVMPSNHLVLCHPLLLLPLIFPSIRVFSSELVLCIRWPNYWSFSSSNNPSNTYSGLISFRIDWFGLLSVQGTVKSLLQHCSSKASILQHSAFLKDGPALTSVCMSTGKTRVLTI